MGILTSFARILTSSIHGDCRKWLLTLLVKVFTPHRTGLYTILHSLYSLGAILGSWESELYSDRNQGNQHTTTTHRQSDYCVFLVHGGSEGCPLLEEWHALLTYQSDFHSTDDVHGGSEGCPQLEEYMAFITNLPERFPQHRWCTWRQRRLSLGRRVT